MSWRRQSILCAGAFVFVASCSRAAPLDRSLAPDTPASSQAEVSSASTAMNTAAVLIAEDPPVSIAVPESSIPVDTESTGAPRADGSLGEVHTNDEIAGQPDDAGPVADPVEEATDAKPSRDERCETVFPPPLTAHDGADTWEGTAVIVPEKAVGLAADVPVGPVALSQLDGAELAFHGACDIQVFERDGYLKREWSFSQPVRNVYPDGAGGIVYEQHGDAAHSRGLRWWPADADSPTAPLADSVTLGDGGLKSYFGVTVVAGSPVVLYTNIEWPEDENECVGCNPNYREVLHRKGLVNSDSLRLGDVGGYEWSFEPKAITPKAIYGFNSTDGGQWNSVVAVDPESSDGLPFIRRSDDFDGDCFDRSGSLVCPELIVPVGDDFLAGFTAFSDGCGTRLYVLARVEGTSHEIVEFFPVVLVGNGWNVLDAQVWGQRVVLNTSNAQAHLGGRRVEHLRRPIIVDLASRTAEVYDRYGTLHLTPIWD